MNYIHIETGEYPITQEQMRARHPNMLFPEPFEPADGYAPVQFGTLPAHDPATQRVVDVAPVEEGGEWRQAFEVVQLTPAEIDAAAQDLRERLTVEATAQRWAVETGGIRLPSGVRVATGLEDQNRITSVIANAQIAGVASVDFKAASGWVSLTLAELQAIAAAIALHVQSCFAAERAHHEAIAAAGPAALRAYDVAQGWPS